MWPFLAVGHVQKSGTKFLKIFFTHVPTGWGHVKKYGTKFLKICFTHVPTSWRHVRDICSSSAKSICYFSVCHWIISQGSTHNNRGARGGGATPGARAPVVVRWALAEYSMANRKNSIYSWQRTGIYFWPNSWKYFAPMYPLAGDMSKIWDQIPGYMFHPCTHFWDFFKIHFPQKSWHGMAWNIHDTAWHATCRTWHAKNNMTRQKYGAKFLKIFFTHVPTSWGHVKKSRTKFLKICFTHVPTSWRHVKNICPSSAKSICYFSVCHLVISQGSTHNNMGARGEWDATPGRAPLLLCVELWLITQWQTEN